MVDIKSLLQHGENENLEVKSAEKGLPKSLWETYSAFANTNGGIILLGVKETVNGFEIVGVRDHEKYIEEIWANLHNRTKTSANILLNHHVYVQEIDTKSVIVIEVPRANRRDKPIFINDDLFHGSYRRNSAGDYHCIREDVQDMVRDNADVTQDMKLVEDKTMASLAIDSIRGYRNIFHITRLDHVWNHLDDDEFLIKIGAARFDELGVLRPTIAGLIMFGYEYEIMTYFPNYFLDYREELVPGYERWSHRITSQSGDWSGNIFDFFYKISSRITSQLEIPFKIQPGTMQRIDDTPMHKALREILANTLIHANYYGRRGLVIVQDHEKITFTNPGALRIAREEAMSGGVSDPRNTVLFKMFSMLNIGERAGSGLANLQYVWMTHHMKMPILHEKFSPDQTILVVPLAKEESAVNEPTSAVNHKIGAVNDERSAVNEQIGAVNNENSDDVLTVILHFIERRGCITSSELAEFLGCGQPWARKLLGKLHNLGKIEHQGTYRNRTYVLKDPRQDC